MLREIRILFLGLTIPVLFYSTVIASSAIPVSTLGPTLYQAACSNCHAPGLSKGLGAPTAFDQHAWKKRINTAKQKIKKNPQGINDAYHYLAYQVQHGKGLMHHGGLCIESRLPPEDCSEDAYIAAIRYMSQPKTKK